MTLTRESEIQAKLLIDGAQRTFRNADELFSEARNLASHGAVARAYLLHQISLEECGKIEIIVGAVTQLLMGETVDMKRLARAFTRHESKNKMNAYFMPRSEQEEAAVKNNSAAALAAFKALQEEFHGESNALKNASLYVDFDQKFLSPSDVITLANLGEICQRNAEFMGLTQPKVDMLGRWDDDLTAAAASIAEIFKAVGFDSLTRAPGSAQTFMESFESRIAALVKARDARRSKA
jgi:AbiV family abortive infection protein